MNFKVGLAPIYLTGRSQRVVINGHYSDWLPVLLRGRFWDLCSSFCTLMIFILSFSPRH